MTPWTISVGRRRRFRALPYLSTTTFWLEDSNDSSELALNLRHYRPVRELLVLWLGLYFAIYLPRRAVWRA
jgi:hypothetical protein